MYRSSFSKFLLLCLLVAGCGDRRHVSESPDPAGDVAVEEVPVPGALPTVFFFESRLAPPHRGAERYVLHVGLAHKRFPPFVSHWHLVDGKLNCYGFAAKERRRKLDAFELVTQLRWGAVHEIEIRDWPEDRDVDVTDDPDLAQAIRASLPLLTTLRIRLK